MKIISIFQAIVAVVLIVSILLQSRGQSLGTAFGGGGGGGSYHTKRGFEKFLLYLSIVLGALFIVLGALNIFLQQ